MKNLIGSIVVVALASAVAVGTVLGLIYLMLFLSGTYGIYGLTAWLFIVFTGIFAAMAYDD